jgi:hypothetical protein
MMKTVTSIHSIITRQQMICVAIGIVGDGITNEENDIEDNKPHSIIIIRIVMP